MFAPNVGRNREEIGRPGGDQGEGDLDLRMAALETLERLARLGTAPASAIDACDRLEHDDKGLAVLVGQIGICVHHLFGIGLGAQALEVEELLFLGIAFGGIDAAADKVGFRRPSKRRFVVAQELKILLVLQQGHWL